MATCPKCGGVMICPMCSGSVVDANLPNIVTVGHQRLTGDGNAPALLVGADRHVTTYTCVACGSKFLNLEAYRAHVAGCRGRSPSR